MAGVKGRSGGPRANSGGKRAGAGRKAKVAPHIAAEPETTSGEPVPDGLLFLGRVVRDEQAPIVQRVRAAIELARYQNERPGETGKKERQQEAAKDAAQVTRYEARPAPLKLVRG